MTQSLNNVAACDPPCVRQAVARLWPGATWSAEPLDGGMTNRNFKVEVQITDREQRTVVVQEQLPDALAARVGIHRENQVRAMAMVLDLGLAPEVLGQWTEPRVLVSEFVEGALLSAVPDRVHATALVGQALAKLHKHTQGVVMTGPISDPYSGTAWILNQVKSEAPATAETFAWTMDILARIQAACGPYTPSLLHSDVSEGNVIILPDRAVLIDWEYVGAGDPYYDVGDFAEKVKLSSSEEETLLCAYDGVLVPTSLAMARLYRFVSMLREALWSVRAGTTGFTEFDYANYARACLARMREISQSSEFADSLHLLENTNQGEMNDLRQRHS